MGGPSGSTTTRLTFRDTELELSGPLPAMQVDATGAMVLRFTAYTGTITLRPSASASAAAGGSKKKQQQEDSLLAELDEELGGKGEMEEEGGKENAGQQQQQQEEQEAAAGAGGKRKKQQQEQPPKATSNKRSGAGAAGGKKGAAAATVEENPAVATAAAATTTTPSKGKRDGASGGAGSAAVTSSGGGASVGGGSSARKRARRGERSGGNNATATNNPLASPAPSAATTTASSSRPSTAATLAPSSPAPTRGSAPQGRWGHSATVVGEGRMVVYGGEGDDPATGAPCTFGDLFVFELDADGKGGKWERPLNCDSIPRCWHSATFLPGKNLLVAFGGERMGEGGIPEVLDDIMALDTELFLWYPPAISGKPPTARSGHSASLVGKDIVIFGGSRGRKWCVNTIQCLDVERWSWRSPSIYGNGPAGRSYHSATVLGNGHQVVYFGGNDGDRCYNRVHVLQVGGIPGGPKEWEWLDIEVVGPAPAPRTGHAACLLGDGKTVLVQGGWDPQGEETLVYEDAFLLDTEQWEWTGPLPPAQAQALLQPTDNRHDQQQQAQQEEQEQAEAAPMPGLLRGGPPHPHPGFLVGHTAVLAAASDKGKGGGKEEGGKVLMFGGQDRLGVRREDLLVLEG